MGFSLPDYIKNVIDEDTAEIMDYCGVSTEN
jgi:hypothetical protein